MDRREAIKRSAILMGGVIFAPTIAGVLNGCTAKPGTDWTPKLFNREQAAMISELSEVIIPATDTPGAKDAGVPAFMDQLVAETYRSEDREHYLSELKAFNERAKVDFGSGFLDLSDEQKHEYVSTLNEEALTGGHPGPGTPFILQVKEQVILGFCISEPGATQVLKHMLTPGRQAGCIPFEEVGRTWSM